MSDMTTISFDFEALARKYRIEPAILKQLSIDAYAEFPYDQMMAELHIVRALRSLARKNVN